MSKADYLRKYASGTDCHDEKKKKKKKSSMKSKNGGLKIISEDSFMDVPAPKAMEGKSLMDTGDEEDIPTVVNSDGGVQICAGHSMGQWESSGGAKPVASSRARPTAVPVHNDSDSDSPPRRTSRRSRSNSNSSGSQPRRQAPMRRARSDSSSSSSSDEDVPRRRTRHDSDSDASSDHSVPRRPRGDDGGVGEGEGERVVGRETETRVRMASGHLAGLQTGKEFGEQERMARLTKDEEMRAIDPTLSGAQAQTVYRDKKGKKMDMLNEYMRQQAIEASRKQKLKDATDAWGQGTAQKTERESETAYVASMAHTSFARYADDKDIEKAQKQVIHDDDPMAVYMRSKQEKSQAREAEATGVVVRPRYKGPAAPPNRFGIAPGYRWDGVDRGNGWEAKVLHKMARR